MRRFAGPRDVTFVYYASWHASTLTEHGTDMNGGQLCSIDADDGHRITIRYWCPAEASGNRTPHALLVVSHGLAEHSGRYAALGSFLSKHGLMTICHDHRGHGSTADRLGHYADRQGWRKVTQDLMQVIETAHMRHPQSPIVLLGHSMGSFIAQSALASRELPVAAAIFSGSNLSEAGQIRLGIIAARGSRLLYPPRKPNPLLHHLSFGNFNKHISAPRSELDWLSRDQASVDAYVTDPYCGQMSTTQLWLDLLGGLKAVSRTRNMARMPAIPYFLLAGDADPVGRYGEGVLALGRALRQHTSKDVQTRLYREGRHEMLNEINSDEVYADLLEWIDARLDYTERSTA